MSTLGDIMAGALSAIRTIEGSPVIEYRTGNSGAWTAITGAVWHKRDVVEEYDDNRQSFHKAATGTLLVPEDGPALLRGYQVRIAEDDDGIWSVREQITAVGSSHYRLGRRVVTQRSQDRGEADS